MKRRWMAGALAALTLVQTPAWAQMLDLPNPGDFGGTDTPAPLAPPALSRFRKISTYVKELSPLIF